MYKFMNNPFIRMPFFEADKGGGAGGSDDGDSGQDDDAGDDGDDQDDDSDKDGDDTADEKKYSQKDMDEAVKKRIAREKRKWQREQQKPDGKGKAGDDDKSEPNADLDKERKRNEKLTMRLACYEAGVPKDSVKDVTALAKAYMEEDDDLDFEDAIEEVLKKYPQFKGSSDDSGEKGAWGQRQKGKGSKKEKSMEDEIADALFGK